MSLRVTGLTILLLANATAVLAQSGSLPAASRTIYKCLVDGRTSYSDSPCLGAQVIDVEPTRGLDKLSGRKLVGSNVSREKHREALSEALQPLANMSADELKLEQHRQKLEPAARLKCLELDAKTSRAETVERSASGKVLQTGQLRLFDLRTQFRQLSC